MAIYMALIWPLTSIRTPISLAHMKHLKAMMALRQIHPMIKPVISPTIRYIYRSINPAITPYNKVYDITL